MAAVSLLPWERRLRRRLLRFEYHSDCSGSEHRNSERWRFYAFGADAVAGVVNIKLYKDYRGAQLTLYYGDTLDKDAGRVIAATFFLARATTKQV